ncbi:MAG TPA: hypothetical protein VJA86_04405 [Candidatus Nanoarchaeia archaeon]|nr:hypothetical protein [Candidatus Nanoarchaeia archaeon]
MAKDAAVKIDRELLKKVEEFARKNKFLYSSKKQVVNLAILEFLNSKAPEDKERASKGGKKG